MTAEKLSDGPPAPTRHRLSAESRRATILQAAAICFAGDGYERTSMDDVAATAGVSKPVVYDHFPSKEALYLGLLTSLSDRLFAGNAAALVPTEPNMAAIAAAIAVVVRFARETPGEAGLLFEPPPGEGPTAVAARAIQERASIGIALLIGARAPGAAPWRHRLAAEFAKSGLHAAALWSREHPEIDAEVLTGELTALVWSGLAGTFGLKAGGL